ncbi:hypothetical protein JD844_000932 [Phrynosoma platyrhinos]|uniref:PDZ domain-containing protein n=1 Tax=Phrynosoma platyrhinos TaxID=52577 RepID=A0ABQ7T904_PHRPL|nr:hypothetical protein JD844_000932 [Phrynosoma platyrhinos]
MAGGEVPLRIGRGRAGGRCLFQLILESQPSCSAEEERLVLRPGKVPQPSADSEMDMGGEGRIPYDDYPVVFLPPYESPPAWIPPHERIYHCDYNNELTQFLPRTIVLKKPPGAQLGFNIRGGKASQLGIFISKVIPDSDAHRAGLQEGDQVLAVNDAVEILKTAREIIMRVRFFPYNYQRQKERTVH